MFFTVAAVLVAASSAFSLEQPCVVTSFADVPGAIANCTNIVIKDMTVPGGQTLELDLKPASTLTFEGKILFEVYNWAGPLVSIKGTDIKVEGAPGHVLDGQGKQYWDGMGGHGSAKPSFFSISWTEHSTFNNISILNCPINCVSIVSSDYITVDGFTVDVSAGDEKGVNTDGFGITYSTNILVKNSVVMNQDDCVVVNQGENIELRGMVCSGGHGLSFSVGFGNISIAQNTVRNVTFKDCTVKNSANGLHIKTHPDAGKGSITDVTYSNLKLSNITRYGITIQQDYPGQGQEPKGNILIKNLKLESVKGTMVGSDAMPVLIVCGEGGCEDWDWEDIDITGGHLASDCNYEPKGYHC